MREREKEKRKAQRKSRVVVSALGEVEVAGEVGRWRGWSRPLTVTESGPLSCRQERNTGRNTSAELAAPLPFARRSPLALPPLPTPAPLSPLLLQLLTRIALPLKSPGGPTFSLFSTDWSMLRRRRWATRCRLSVNGGGDATEP